MVASQLSILLNTGLFSIHTPARNMQFIQVPTRWLYFFKIGFEKTSTYVLEDSLHCHQQKQPLVCPFAYLLSLFLHLKVATEANNPSKIKLPIQFALHYKRRSETADNLSKGQPNIFFIIKKRREVEQVTIYSLVSTWALLLPYT